MGGRTFARKDCGLESRLDVEGVAQPELINQVEGGGAAGEHDVLPAVDLMALNLKGSRLAAEQARTLVEVDVPAPLGEREPGAQAGQPGPDDGDTWAAGSYRRQPRARHHAELRRLGEPRTSP